jgi:LCP family protein required for cell wall assembly
VYIKKVLVGIAMLIACALVVTIGYGFYQLTNVKAVNIQKDNDSLGISFEYEEELKKRLNKKAPNVDNILLLGIDDHEIVSDTIIVMSIDYDHKKLKLTSIMRDSYVDLKDKEVKKLNYAYHYGGPQLAIKTINENYNLNIKDYCKVDFDGLARIIDIYGGINVVVQEHELKDVAWCGVKQAGTYNFNGEQVVGFCRTRWSGDGDYERTQRQRQVLTSLINKIRESGISKCASAMPVMLSGLETSIDKGDILALAAKVINSFKGGIEQLRLPVDRQEFEEEGIFYLRWDSKLNIDTLHKFIYED